MESTATEADTCRKLVVPKLLAAGWDDEPHSIAEQRTITDGRIVPVGKGFVRKAPKRVDYLLRYTRDFPLAVVEAKAAYKAAADGVQQARQYVEMLGLKFAYATNGHEIIEIDYTKGRERQVDRYPTPAELWARYCGAGGLSDQNAERLLTPAYYGARKSERYYQQIAINRAVEAILRGNRRLLVTMATGTGKTVVAFQICWKLWSARWNRTGQYRRPKILYLADRNILVDQPKDGIFAAFGDARTKIEAGEVVKSREMYFAIYQALAEDERRLGVFKEFAPDFFDLIIVDECHRGSAREESAWRAILQYFAPAVQLGMTATPLREETRDTYRYFGAPIYQYSLRQGIEDGFLAPYRVHRVITEWDMKRHQIAKAGQVILSEIWGKKGAIGFVPPEGEGALCTSHFFLFDIRDDKLDRRWLQAIFNANYLEEQLGAEAKGTTGYAAVRPKDLLNCEIPRLPLEEQGRIVAQIEELTAQIEEARVLLRETSAEAEMFIISLHLQLANSRTRLLGEILQLDEDEITVSPTGSYPQVGVRSFGGGLFPKAAVNGTETTYRSFNRLYDGALVLSQVKGWEGAVAVCPPDLDGWLVSPEYRTFRCIPSEASPRYLSSIVRTEWFWSRLSEATRGVGARRERTRPEEFLALEVPMPTLEEQRRAEAIFEEINTFKRLQAETAAELDVLLPSILDRAFRGEL